jgi:hypothetical protein
LYAAAYCWTLKKNNMTELFESTLKARNIEFTKSLENKGISEYKILSDSLEGIIWLSDSDESAKFFINIPYANFQIYSSHWVIINKDFLAPFESLLDEFVHQLEAHSNRFKEYMGAKTTPPPAPISPSNSLHSQPISPSTTIESILTEREIEFEKVEGNNITYHIKNNYFKPVIYVFPNGEISFCILSNTGNRISATVWDPKNIHAPSLDRILNHFLGQFESYYNAFSLIKENLIKIKEICDYNCIRYDSLDMDLKNYTN